MTLSGWMSPVWQVFKSELFRTHHYKLDNENIRDKLSFLLNSWEQFTTQACGANRTEPIFLEYTWCISIDVITKINQHSCSRPMLTWRRQDMEALSTSLVRCQRNQMVTCGFRSQRASYVGFNVFFDVSLNTLFNKQPSCRWFDMSQELKS